MTDLEIIKTVIDTLDGINIPVTMTEKVGIPILNSSTMLKRLYNAIVEKLNAQLKEKEEKEKSEEEPEVTPQIEEGTSNETDE